MSKIDDQKRCDQGTIEPGARVAVVEDIISTGPSSRECVVTVQAAGDKLGFAVCIVDRSEVRTDLGTPLVALTTLDLPVWLADASPPTLAALQQDGRGSRGPNR
jgi:orotate phosphoribosyltransferase